MSTPAIRAVRPFRFFHDDDEEILALRDVSLRLDAGSGPPSSWRRRLE